MENRILSEESEITFGERLVELARLGTELFSKCYGPLLDIAMAWAWAKFLVNIDKTNRRKKLRYWIKGW